MADAPNANDELYPIAVLIDELKVPIVPCPPRDISCRIPLLLPSAPPISVLWRRD